MVVLLPTSLPKSSIALRNFEVNVKMFFAVYASYPGSLSFCRTIGKTNRKIRVKKMPRTINLMPFHACLILSASHPEKMNK